MAQNTGNYETLLETLLDELTKELQTVGINNPENPSDWVAAPEGTGTNLPDENDAADRVEEWDERRAIVATLEARYNNITRALEKIKNGSYGICEICETAIETDRLDANPAARTCKTHIEEETNLSN